MNRRFAGTAAPRHWGARAAARRRRWSGFTLLEVLVVLVIIGIVTGFVVLSIGGTNVQQRVDREARRLRALLELASQEAVLRSRHLGLLVYDDRYRFVAQTDGQWRAPDDRLWRARKLPRDMRVHLSAGGPAAAPITADRGGGIPQVVLLPDGEMTPFELRFGTPDGMIYYRLNGTANGRLELKRTAGNP